jgi:hypothetical protein
MTDRVKELLAFAHIDLAPTISLAKVAALVQAISDQAEMADRKHNEALAGGEERFGLAMHWLGQSQGLRVAAIALADLALNELRGK